MKISLGNIFSEIEKQSWADMESCVVIARSLTLITIDRNTSGKMTKMQPIKIGNSKANISSIYSILIVILLYTRSCNQVPMMTG